MIVVDTSVWIDHLAEKRTAAVEVLRATILRGRPELIVGDIVLAEVLQGLATEKIAARVEQELRRFRVHSMLDPDLAVLAARNYRTLRRLGITVRKTIDMFIATFCIEHDHALLHVDRDFDPMAQYLGLRVIDASMGDMR